MGKRLLSYLLMLAMLVSVAGLAPGGVAPVYGAGSDEVLPGIDGLQGGDATGDGDGLDGTDASEQPDGDGLDGFYADEPLTDDGLEGLDGTDASEQPDGDGLDDTNAGEQPDGDGLGGTDGFFADEPPADDGEGGVGIMAFGGEPILPFAEEGDSPRPRARVVAQHKGGMFSRPYVEIEMNGQIFKTNEGNLAANRQLFAWLSEEDKGKVFESYGNYLDRYEHFGGQGNKEIADWAGINTKWAEGARIWQDRLAKKNFPELYAFYESPSDEVVLEFDGTQVTMAQMMNPANTYKAGFSSPKTYQDPLYDKYMEQYTRFVTARDYGKACYDALKSAKVLQTQTAVKALSAGILNIIKDNLLVPAVFPDGTAQFSGAIADVTNLMLDVTAEYVDLSEMLGYAKEPDPVEIINKLWKVIDKNEAAAKEMVQISRMALAEIGVLVPQLKEMDKYNKQLDEYVYNQNMVDYTEIIDQDEIGAYDYDSQFTPSVDYETDPVTVREEARLFILEKIQAIGDFDMTDFRDQASHVKNVGYENMAGGNSYTLFYTGENPYDYPYYSQHSAGAVLAGDAYDSDLASIEYREAAFARKANAIEELIPVADSLVTDYRDKVSRWKGLKALAEKYSVSILDVQNNPTTKLSAAKGNMDAGGGSVGLIDGISDGSVFIRDAAAVNESAHETIVANKAALEQNGAGYKSYVQSQYKKFQTQNSNYEREIAFYAQTWQELCALRDNFRYYDSTRY
ncbi:MAG: hypothetical protein FWG03_10365, partial [Clostridiales bacterium]|nr:hypothetical protein [Clostridiales bacterium]